MRNTITAEQVNRFREIIGEMKELLHEARNILRDAPSSIQERAKAYPLGHIATSLDNDNEYLSHDVTLEDIADELGDAAELDEDEDES